MNRIFTIVIAVFAALNVSAQTIYNANYGNINFLQANKVHKVGTNGSAAGNKTLYTNVITIGGQNIDCIVTTISLTNGTFTLPGSAASGTIPFDYSSSTGTAMSSNADRYFAPTFNFSSGGGNAKFRFEFILGGSYNNSTNTGTAVTLQNVQVNTYDIDGNGGSNTNQYNEFGGFSAVTLSTGTNISATYNSATNLTKYRSNTNANTTTVTDDANRISVKYTYVSLFEIVVGADGSGAAYYFIDFGAGPAWSGATTVTNAPLVDLDPNTAGINYTASACKTEAALTAGSTNLVQTSGTVDSILYEFNSTDIIDGNFEALIPKGAAAADTLKLGFAATATQTFTFGGNGITVNKIVSGTSRKLKIYKTNGTAFTAAQAETLIDSIVYRNSKTAPSNGVRTLTIVISQGAFKSAGASSAVTISCSTLPVNWISFTGRSQENIIRLNWTVAAEHNVKEYTIQHSSNGSTWTDAGVVAATSSNGSANNYSFNHTRFIQGNNHYRIAEKDLDGTIQYSKVIVVNTGSEESLRVYPNPATGGTLTIQMPAAGFIQVFNASGTLVVKKQLEAGTQQINISTLSKGIYFIKAGNASSRVVVK